MEIIVDHRGLPVPRLRVADLAQGTVATVDSLRADLGSKPEWSQDSSRVLFATEGTEQASIVLWSLSTGELTQITQSDGKWCDPKWSSDNGRVVARCKQEGTYAAVVIDLVTQEQHRVSDAGSYVMFASWISETDSVALVQTGEAGARLLSASPQEAGATELLSTQEAMTDCAVSPRGDQVALGVVGRTTEGSAVWLVPMSSGAPRKITLPGTRPLRMAWSPDALQIAFDLEVEGQRDLFVMDAASGTLTRLTDGAENDAYPTWRLAAG